MITKITDWLCRISLVTVSLLASSAVGQVTFDVPQADHQPALSAPLSLALSGNNAHLIVPPSASLSITGPITIEAWMKSPDYAGQMTILERYNQDVARDGRGGYGLSTNAGSAVFTLCPGDLRFRCVNAYSSATLATNVWQHVAAVFDGAEMRMYINGVLAGRRSIRVRPPGPTNGELRIGSTNASLQPFTGLIDEIRLSNSSLYLTNFELSAQLVSQNSTVGLWKFDNGSAIDWSSHGNNAVMMGGAAFSPDVPSVPTVAFQIVPTPNVGPSNRLKGIKTISPTEVWAVGEHGPPTYCCFPKEAVSLRWNGLQWVSVPLPPPFGPPAGFSTGNTLVDVDAANGSSVWAFGIAGSNSSARVVLIRWNGSSWIVAGEARDPQYPMNGIGTAKAMTVISDTDIWIVGARIGGASWTLHWDGTSLTTVPSPNLDMGGNGLADVDATAPDNVYAVGSFMVIRWNGSEWVPVSQTSRNIHYLSVAVAGLGNVWLGGRLTTCGPFSGCSSQDGLFRLFDGQFAQVGISGLSAQQVSYNALDAVGPNNVWLAGYADARTLVAHFDGTTWRRIPSQNTPITGGDLDELLDISVLDSTEVWTVGFYSDVFYEPQYQNIVNNLALRRTLIP